MVDAQEGLLLQWARERPWFHYSGQPNGKFTAHCTLSTKQKSPQPSISSKLFWRISLLISSHLNVSNPRKMQESILNPSSSLFGSVPKPPAARVKIKLHDAIRDLDNLLNFTSPKVRPAMGIFPTHTYIYIYIYHDSSEATMWDDYNLPWLRWNSPILKCGTLVSIIGCLL